jgi:hypothetical protein
MHVDGGAAVEIGVRHFEVGVVLWAIESVYGT